MMLICWLVFVWKISESSEGDDQPQITGRLVLALQILGEEDTKHPRVCWHTHRQIVGKHDGEVTDLSMCQWMITRLVSSSGYGTGPLNREMKIWVSDGEEGWLVPADTESWNCTQTLELKSLAAPQAEEAFFNQVIALPEVGLLLLAYAKRNTIYVVHLNYGSYPVDTQMDYLSEFPDAIPILGFTGTINTQEESIVEDYCVQTQAIQLYTLDLCSCLPPPVENVGLQKSDSF